MRKAVSALLFKDLHQIRKVFIFLVLFSLAIAWFQARLMNANNQLVSYLAINSFYAMPVLLALAFILGQNLITKEYYGHTQRFIEALPVKRIHMAAVKFFVGLISLLMLAFLVWGFSLKLASNMEPLSGRFIAIMATRLCIYVIALWSLVFTFSLLGRLRIPLVALCYFIVSSIDSYTGFELNRFGPMSLIANDLFSAERFYFPIKEIKNSLIFSGFFLLLSCWLVHLREGSFIEKLASPMSGKEKVFLLVIIVVGTGIFISFQPEEEEPLFTMTNNFVLSDNRVKVSYLAPQVESTARTLASEVSSRLQTLEQFVPFPSDEFVYQIHLSPSLEPTDYTIELTSARQGLVTTANFLPNTEWSFNDFSTFIIHTTLVIETNNRAILEPVHWLLDGAAMWITLNYADVFTDSETSATSLNPYLLQAIYATQIKALNSTMLRQWDVTSDTLGDSLALSLAYSGLQFIQNSNGYDTVSQLIAGEYQRPAHGDIRDWWAEWRNPPQDRFEASTHLNWEEFIDGWASYLETLSLQPAYQQALKTLPRISASIIPTVSAEGLNQVRYQMQLDRPFPANTRCTALHSPLPHFDILLGRDSLLEEPIEWSNDPLTSPSLSIEHLLTGKYGSRSRVYAAIECKFALFEMPVRVAYARLLMP